MVGPRTCGSKDGRPSQQAVKSSCCTGRASGRRQRDSRAARAPVVHSAGMIMAVAVLADVSVEAEAWGSRNGIHSVERPGRGEKGRRTSISGGVQGAWQKWGETPPIL